MINNKDIIDCFDIAYSNTINHDSIIRDYDEVKSDNDIGFKLLCNKKEVAMYFWCIFQNL